jgi:protein-disulfide isomerase
MATASLAHAQGAGLKAPAFSHPELQKFVNEGGKVDFLGTAYGLDGWMLTKDGIDPRTVYTNKEGGMVMGMLIAPSGIVETPSQLAALQARQSGSQQAMPGAENANASKGERAYAELEKARWIKVGQDSAPYIYVLINVSCSHCQKFWKDLQPMIKAGKVQVRLLPFGAQAVNRDGGAALYAAADPAAAWLSYIDGKADVLDKTTAKSDGYKAVDDNTKIVSSWKMKGEPPYTFYRKLTDGAIVAIVGRPENMMLLQADLLK